MRIAIHTSLLLALFCSSGICQQARPVFKIAEPTAAAGTPTPSEARYYAQLQREQAALAMDVPQIVAPTSVALNGSKHAIRLSQSSVQEQTWPAVSAQPHRDVWTKPTETASTGGAVSMAQFSDAFTHSAGAFIVPDFRPQPPTQSFAECYTEIRNHCFFGVDRETCCDEWAGFCRCNGLKANPGHLGLPWLRGDDPCECTECAVREKRKQRKANRCGCEDCNSRGGLLDRWKLNHRECAECSSSDR